jgi:hypothetical protein
MIDVARSERLFGLLVLALTWGLLVGELVTAAQATPVKKHGYELLSRFQQGLDAWCKSWWRGLVRGLCGTMWFGF